MSAVDGQPAEPSARVSVAVPGQSALSAAAVIVTGGTRGIGAGIARGFLRAGAQVLVCGRTEPAGAASLPGANGRTAAFVRADLRDPEQAQRLIGAAVDRFGRLDVVVSNAGGSPSA